MSRLTANIDSGSKAVTRTKGLYRSNWKHRNGIVYTVYRKTGCGKESYEICFLKVIIFINLGEFIHVVLLMNGISINELNAIDYYSVNSATSFGLTDQHQNDQQYDRTWRVIWKSRWHFLSTCIVRLSIYTYIYVYIYIY